MKIVIDIDEEIYNLRDYWSLGISLIVREAIRNGTLLPDNATNGDVIKALFPDMEIADTPCLDKVYTGIPFGKYIGANIDCMRDWWNAPYKAGGTDDRLR